MQNSHRNGHADAISERPIRAFSRPWDEGPPVWAGRSIGLRAAEQNRALTLTSWGVEFYRVAEGALDRAQVVPDMLSDLFPGKTSGAPGAGKKLRRDRDGKGVANA